MSAEDRLKTVARHLTAGSSSPSGDSLEAHPCSSTTDGGTSPPPPPPNDSKQCSRAKPVASAIPKIRQDLLKWNGWGYKDSQFGVNADKIIHFTGTRYAIGQLDLPYFTQWVADLFAIDFTNKHIPQPMPTSYPEPTVDQGFLAELRSLNIPYSVEGIDRLFRAHGHTLHDIFVLRGGEFERIPDIVVWPESHAHVVSLVELSNRHNVAVIPFGGGTSVTGGVWCPPHERRTILSLDTSQMNRILWVDRENLVACVEAGIIGQDLEREMRARGLTCGHEPDSYEFSSLGGWVATRASGMKKNAYGNIEDLIVAVRMVSPAGVLERAGRAPRVSCGPDFNHIVMGSEGTLGVVTEVTMKVRPLPPVMRYGSIAFPHFSAGVACMREVARQRCQPASIRLMDNEQFKFGQALRAVPTLWGSLVDGLKRAYITRIKGFNVDHMCVATLLFEGDAKTVEAQEKQIYKIALESGGIPAGETNGERGYTLTFVIAYIRDLGLDYDIVAESFETSVPWDRTEALCRNVKHRVATECKALSIDRYLISCRVTQTYDAGCCVYFYFGFKFTGLADPLASYEHIEEMARDEILASGGSLSHHHGIGKLRRKWLPSQVSPLGVSLYHAAKAQLDPNNIFANGNLHQRKANL